MSLQKQNQDRTVSLQGPTDTKDALSHMRASSESYGISEKAIPKFTQVKDYTTFRAEHAIIDDDVVIHFFKPDQVKVSDDYWKVQFADALSTVAQVHFQAAYPRLAAKFTEDDGIGNKIDSWWFRARNYVHILNIDHYLEKFFDALDTVMDPRLPRTE